MIHDPLLQSSWSLRGMEQTVLQSPKDFIRGFLVGQLALVLIILVLLRFLFFRTASKTPRRDTPTSIRFAHAAPGKRHAHDTGSAMESCAWLNSLCASILFARLQNDDLFWERLSGRLGAALCALAVPTYLERIRLLRLELGPEPPRVLWARPSAVFGSKECAWEFCIEWRAPFKIGVETALLLQWPPHSSIASLPCSLDVALEMLRATVLVCVQGETAQIALSPDDFEMQMHTGSLVGHRTTLRDVPKIQQLLTDVVKTAIKNTVIWPSVQTVKLPELYNLIDLSSYTPPPTKHTL